jgi:hypothetical protein
MTMLAESNFIIKSPEPIELLKNEAIDRLASIVGYLPKYKKQLDGLILNFTIDDMLQLINTIYRDQDFKCSLYYSVYNDYFDEIEELIFKISDT